MAELPLLTTNRLSIEPFNESFLTETYIGWLNDPQVTRFSQQRWRRHDRNSCLAFLHGFAKSDSHFSALRLRGGDGAHIGNISTSVDIHNGVADIAIMIGARAVWGQGYGYEAWKAVQDHLLLHVSRMVTGGCMAHNLAMKTIMEKSGMQPYYTRRHYFRHEDGFADSIHYMIEARS